MQIPVTCDSLGELGDGAARLIIDAAIRQAVSDIEDRGADEKPRKVEIILTLQQLENGLVTAEVEAAYKAPRFRTASTIACVKRKDNQPALLFSQFAQDDPSQRTLDDAGA